MDKQTEEYYKWADVRLEICNEMGINVSDFRNYHNVVGGEYKDLWHVWLDFNAGNVHNDTICYTWLDNGDTEYWIEKKGEWTREFFEAVERVYEKHDWHINIKYYW